jgi:hypothetical protein
METVCFTEFNRVAAGEIVADAHRNIGNILVISGYILNLILRPVYKYMEANLCPSGNQRFQDGAISI